MAVRPVKASGGSTSSSGSGGITFVGFWNAQTNTPDLNIIPADNGDYYIVSTSGTSNIDGNAYWRSNDWAVFNGSVWNRINNTGQIRTVEFSGSGPLIVSEFVGQVWINKTGEQLTITDVSVWQQTAGISGDLIIDIFVNEGLGWTSIWNINPSNRPTLNYSNGDDTHISGGIPDIIVIPIGARIRMDIVSIQSGNPDTIFVQITF